MIERHIAGDTLDFLDIIDGYPSTEWTLTYRVVPTFTTPVQTPIQFGSLSEGSDYRVVVAASTTALWTPGVYTWTRWVSGLGRRVTVGTGRFEILANPETAGAGYDTRTQAEKALDDAKTALATYTATNGMVASYTIGTRSMTFRGRDEILVQIRYWEGEVEKEQRLARLAIGLPNKNKIYVRF